MLNTLNTPYRYVLPIPDFLRGKLLEYNRLYAYPNVPESPAENGFVILDSGAFGLSFMGKKMDLSYMQDLSGHYARNNFHEHIYCVAPDEFLNPYNTLKNLEKWLANSLYSKVCVVFQCKQKRVVDKASILFLLEQYEDLPHDRRIAFFSNPSLNGRQALQQQNEISYCLDAIKERGYGWIHNLGAGWNVDDIQSWSRIANFESMDSIAYYTSVQQKEFWTNENYKTDKRIRYCLVHARIGNEQFIRLPIC